MAVSVSAPDLEVTVFPDATAWHVDDDGRLHIIKAGDGNVATFHHHYWANVQRHAEAD